MYGDPGTASAIIADDKGLITYRPKLREITGSVTATILLQQVMYWAKLSNNKFYKFTDKCNHKLYKEGDSWCEELGFSTHEFATAIKRIGFKLGKTKNAIEKKDALIIYYTDNTRLTFYSVNWDNVNKQLDRIYSLNAESAFTKENKQSAITSNTEITSETTKEKGSSGKDETSIPFKNYCDEYKINDDKKQAINYYLYRYHIYANEPHHNYKPSTWRYIADQLLTVELDNETIHLSTDDEAMMIDKHFNTTYKDCNYHLTHYVSDKVRELRYYEMIKPIKG